MVNTTLIYMNLQQDEICRILNMVLSYGSQFGRK